MKNHWDKKLLQMVKDPAGRAAMKKLGIDIEIGKPDLADKPIVAILCPTYRGPQPLMKDAMTRMIEYSREQGIIVYTTAPYSASVVHWSRNGLIQAHLKSGKPWTHVLFIDDDITVEPDTIVRLLSHKKDIVAGLCTMRQDPPLPNMRLYDEESGKYQQIWEWPEGQLVGDHKRLAVGTGLMLISQHALEQVAQAYFDCLWEVETYGLAGDKLETMKAQRLDAFDKDKVCYWFRFLNAPKAPVEMGEDISFCYMATRYCDVPVYVDTAVTPGHLGSYPYSIRDFLPHRDECVLRAKINGQYKMEVSEMKISILCPTRGRPENVKRLLDSIKETSTVMPQVVFYRDDDDAPFPLDFYWSQRMNVKVVNGPRIKMAEMWNRCAEVAEGEILMVAGDDIVFRTKGWDDDVRRAFAAFPDRLVMVHGNDGVYAEKFGTHFFLHRNWVDAVGYVTPPYFEGDFVDTWWNEIATALNRRIYFPFVTEHMHPIARKAEKDNTYREKEARQKKENSEQLYKELRSERKADFQKLAAIIDGQGNLTRQSQLAAV